MRVGILASGSGDSLPPLLKAMDEKKIECKAVVLIANSHKCHAIRVAQANGLGTRIIPSELKTREAFENDVLECLKENKVDLVLLLEFNRLLSPAFLSHYPNRVWNAHPSLLPKYPGPHASALQHAFFDARDGKITHTGATVHIVDEGMDTGAVIAQSKTEVGKNETLESITKKTREAQTRAILKAFEEFFGKGKAPFGL